MLDPFVAMLIQGVVVSLEMTMIFVFFAFVKCNAYILKPLPASAIIYDCLQWLFTIGQQHCVISVPQVVNLHPTYAYSFEIHYVSEDEHCVPIEQAL